MCPRPPPHPPSATAAPQLEEASPPRMPLHFHHGVRLRPHPPSHPPIATAAPPRRTPDTEEASPPVPGMMMAESRGVRRPHPPGGRPLTERVTAAPQLEAEASPPGPGMSECRGVKRPWERPNDSDNEELPPEPTGWCPQHKVLRTECFRAGDWVCPVCGQHNFPSKLDCSNHRCQAPKGATVPCAPTPQWQAPPPVGPASSWCTSCRRPRSECWKPNDWECPWCKNHNYARKQVVAAECSAGWEWVCL